MRILGIDYGTKRIGVAISDPNAEFALPHAVIKNTSTSNTVVNEIISIAKLNEVQTIVIGESRDYSGQPNKIMPEVMKLKTALESAGFAVHLELEFMTSVQAERFQGKHDKSDSAAAAIILQSYLDKK
jgi:putative Holliday junction resolvase